MPNDTQPREAKRRNTSTSAARSSRTFRPESHARSSPDRTWLLLYFSCGPLGPESPHLIEVSASWSQRTCRANGTESGAEHWDQAFVVGASAGRSLEGGAILALMKLTQCIQRRLGKLHMYTLGGGKGLHVAWPPCFPIDAKLVAAAPQTPPTAALCTSPCGLHGACQNGSDQFDTWRQDDGNC